MIRQIQNPLGMSDSACMPKPDTEVSDIVHDWLRLNGFDGLCHGALECGCHLDDFLVCQGEGGTFPQCRPAYKFTKQNGEWWMSTNKNWRDDEDDNGNTPDK